MSGELPGEGWTPMEDGGFMGLVGPVWRRPEAGRPTRYGFASEDRHANLLGMVQGGMLMSFADRALGLAAWEAAGQPSVTVQFNAQFLTAARIGAFIEVEPRVVQATRSLVFVEGMLRSSDAEHASAQGIWKKVAGSPGAPER